MVEAIEGGVEESQRDNDFINDVVSLSFERNLLITKESVEYMLMNESQKEKFLYILRKYENVVITPTILKEELDKIKKDIESKIQIIRASYNYEAKNYDLKIESIWNLDTSYEAKTNVNNFIEYFNDRFNKIRSFLLQRNGIRNVVSIERLKKNNLKYEDVSIIVMVRDKLFSKNGFLRFVVEDDTDKILAIPKDEIRKEAENILEDDVIALRGKLNSKGNFIIEEISYPDIPMPSIDSISKLEAPLTAAFLSDLHFGSKLFIKDAMKNFFKWLKSGDSWASRLKVLFILGDNVDGIGIYPNQLEELEIANIYDQYKAFEEFLLKIPEHIKIVVIPGNHDAVRLAEPQPALTSKYLPEATKMDNIYFETNPALVKLSSGEGDGMKVLMYHGYSFNSMIEELQEIRKVAKEKPTIFMRELLKRRHLAPMYGSTLIAPKKIDMHVIDVIPDIFATGDLHSHDVSNYKGVTLISGSTWQAQTSFQDRVGHIANPGKLTLVDLHTREILVKNLLNM